MTWIADLGPSTRRPASEARRYRAAVVAGGLVVAGVALAATLAEAPIGRFTRDPGQIADLDPWVGGLSTLGNLLWAVALGALAMLARLGRGIDRRIGLGIGALTAWCLVDDTFLLHDRVLLDAGVPEKATMAVLAVGVAAVARLVAVRVVELRVHRYFVVAGAWLAGSVLVDLIDPPWSPDLLFLVEDGAKFIGVAVWTVACVELTAAAMRHTGRHGSQRPRR